MANREAYVMTADEVQILQKGALDPQVISGYFFRKPSQTIGFQFDHNFTEAGKWQVKMLTASEALTVIIGGVGTGKTLAAGVGACVHGMMTPGFKFMSVAPNAFQSELMYELVWELAQDTKFAEIAKFTSKPYPKIDISYRVGKILVHSSLQFMCLGDKKNATNIFSWRGDWINIDECGLIDNLDEVVSNLQTRLTGSTPEGRPFLGKMSLLSNPWDTPALWYFYDMSISDPDVLSMTLSTRDNKNVTDLQIKNMLRTIPKEEWDRYLDGKRPEGKGSYFSKSCVTDCEDLYAGDIIRKKQIDGEPGYSIVEVQTSGVISMQTPPTKDGMYFILGDPGNGNAPARNAPVLMVFNADGFPATPARLAAFWWGMGHGSITPFLDKLFHFQSVYKGSFAGIDSTGPQKNMAELLNLGNVEFSGGFSFSNTNDTTKIYPLDFSGGRKMSYLIALRLLIEAGKLSWPQVIKGIRSQLTNYDPALDRGSLPKLPQDIVATMSMVAYVLMAYFQVSDEELTGTASESNNEIFLENKRLRRLSTGERNKRSGR